MKASKNARKETAGKKQNKLVITTLGKRPYLWLYLLFLLVIIFSYLSNRYRPEEISWLEFERDLLATNQVEKIVVVNRSSAHIYIRDAQPEDPEKKDIPNSLLNRRSGPNFAMELGSLESFERKLEEAQKERPKTNGSTCNTSTRATGLRSSPGYFPFCSSSFFGWHCSGEWWAKGARAPFSTSPRRRLNS